MLADHVFIGIQRHNPNLTDFGTTDRNTDSKQTARFYPALRNNALRLETVDRGQQRGAGIHALGESGRINLVGIGDDIGFGLEHEITESPAHELVQVRLDQIVFIGQLAPQLGLVGHVGSQIQRHRLSKFQAQMVNWVLAVNVYRRISELFHLFINQLY